MGKYYNNPEKDKRVRQFLAKLRREARTLPSRKAYLAAGGPWDAQVLYLDPTPVTGRYAEWTGTATAVIRVGNHVGRYREVTSDRWTEMNLLTRLPRGVTGQVVWENAR